MFEVSQKAKYFFIVAASASLSLLGIAWGAVYEPSGGGRGAAVAVAFSFYVLFARGNWGISAQQALERETAAKTSDPESEADTLDTLASRLQAIKVRLNIDSDGQQVQNSALTKASIIGTLAWGFGDLPANWMNAWLKSSGWLSHFPHF
jgi:hypothetical protein